MLIPFITYTLQFLITILCHNPPYTPLLPLVTVALHVLPSSLVHIRSPKHFHHKTKAVCGRLNCFFLPHDLRYPKLFEQLSSISQDSEGGEMEEMVASEGRTIAVVHPITEVRYREER